MKQEILRILPLRLRSGMEQVLQQYGTLEEIRIRTGQPMELRWADGSTFLQEKMSTDDLEEMLTFISRYSLYAYEEEIRQGFVTIEGGHRIGFGGQVRIENDVVRHMVNIRFFNIRIAREKKGCAKEILPWLYQEGRWLSSLLVSLPGVGKTTCLRDCVRLISNGGEGRDGRKVCVIDERSEIAACHLGVPQNDVGIRTDVLDGCPKKVGMQMALRSLSPEVIAVDELGGGEDVGAVEQALLSGCCVFGTAHGKELSHLLLKKGLKEMHQKGLFERYVFLQKTERGERGFQVYDQELRQLC